MGTRNLTAVMSGGKYVIAQYGQWDGHPDGQGSTALEFCKTHLQTNMSRQRFQKKLDRIRFVTDAEVKQLCEKVGAKDGWLNMDQSSAFDKLVPLLNRDHGAGILELVLESDADEILLQDSISFAGDSLFCEYAYVVDLDKNTFEAYKGFQTEPLEAGERFASFKITDKSSRQEYYPVKLMGSWDLDNLPTLKQMCSVFHKPGEDDEDNETDFGGAKEAAKLEAEETETETESLDLDSLEKAWLDMPAGEWGVEQLPEFGSTSFLVTTDPNGEDFEVMAQFVMFGNVLNRETLANSKKDILALVARVRELEEKLEQKK